MKPATSNKESPENRGRRLERRRWVRALNAEARKWDARTRSGEDPTFTMGGSVALKKLLLTLTPIRPKKP